MSPGRSAVSGFVLLVLALQAVPVARELGGARETLWPLASWGLFRHSSHPPVAAIRVRLYAVRPDGLVRVRSGDAGMDRFTFRDRYARAIAAGDPAAARELARRLSARWRAPVPAIVLERTAFRISGDSLLSAPAARRIVYGSLPALAGPGER
ncbi:MAG TPA: hypothetical protein VFQ21_09780 [Gemmatimonadota bacterium]|nr:hypothetical protein [Gemmatimonadota bacterium]